MYKSAAPPLTTSTGNYNSLTVIGPGLFKGGSPVSDYNVKYNNGQVLVLEEYVESPSNNYIIDYYDTPFNYINISSTTALSQIIQVNNCPPMWWFVHNQSSFNIIISPQINGFLDITGSSQYIIPPTGSTVSVYDATNEYEILPNTHCIMCITPGTPPLVDPLRNPTCMELV